MPKIWDARYNSLWKYEEWRNWARWEWWYQVSEPKDTRVVNWRVQIKNIVNWQPVWTDAKTTQVWKSSNWTPKIKLYDNAGNVYWTSDLWNKAVIDESIKQQAYIDENTKLLWWQTSWLNWLITSNWWRQYVNVWWNKVDLSPENLNKALKEWTVTTWWDSKINYSYWTKWQSWLLWWIWQDVDNWTTITYDPIKNYQDTTINNDTWSKNDTNTKTNNNWTVKFWPLRVDTEWIKNYISNLNNKTSSNNWWWNKWWGSKWWSKWYWNWNAVRQPEPTYVDPSGITHTWMTQDEFDASMKMYEADNQWWYENRRNQVVWANWATRWQIFDQALDKFLSDPNAFSEDQKQLLIKAWKELWYFDWTTETSSTSWTPTTTSTVTPTVQPTITTTPTQRKINNANDAYYAWQNAWRWVVL